MPGHPAAQQTQRSAAAAAALGEGAIAIVLSLNLNLADVKDTTGFMEDVHADVVWAAGLDPSKVVLAYLLPCMRASACACADVRTSVRGSMPKWCLCTGLRWKAGR